MNQNKIDVQCKSELAILGKDSTHPLVLIAYEG